MGDYYICPQCSKQVPISARELHDQLNHSRRIKTLTKQHKIQDAIQNGCPDCFKRDHVCHVWRVK